MTGRALSQVLRSILVSVLVLAALSVSWAGEDQIVLTADSVGEMHLESGMPISTEHIAVHFPGHIVTSEMRSGDSPDYRFFKVESRDGELLIGFISYIKEEVENGDVPAGLDEVVLYSPQTVDEFGISPGDEISEALAAREGLIFGAGHMDNHFGRDRIWYLFHVDDLHGVQVSEQRAVESNPRIDVISWPYPRWR